MRFEAPTGRKNPHEDDRFAITWRGTGQKARCSPDPAYPHGKALPLPGGRQRGDEVCTVALPYPAPCIGVHDVLCKRCGKVIAVTAAGRRDDPVSVQILCRKGQA